MAEPIRILVTGGAGQVGLELGSASWPAGVVLEAPDRATLDLSNIDSIRAAFARDRFAAVINAGAYTAVDQAETDVAAAFAVNAVGTAVLAEETRRAGVPLIQISTDYVFDGRKQGPYEEDDPVAPLGVYGASKLAGELAARRGNPRSVVLRTSWVVGVHRANFLKTMLDRAGKHQVLPVVDDQRGCPTSARDLATAIRKIVIRQLSDAQAPAGVYHFTNEGEASWASLASEIFRLSASMGGPTARIEPISTRDYPTAAPRPLNSRLATAKLTRDYGVAPRPWRTAVAEIVAELLNEERAA